MRKLGMAGILAGILVMMPLGFVSLPLLVFFPGFCVYAHMKKRFSIIEMLAASITLSLVMIPLITVPMRFIGLDMMQVVLGLFIIGSSAGLLNKEFAVQSSKRDYIIILLAIVAALIVFFPLLNCFTFTAEGLMANPTHASDLNYHLSIIQRYINAPQIPPEDAYLPGYHIPYNWFVHVFMGEMCKLTDIHPFSMVKIIFPLLLFALFLNVYLLAEYIFDKQAALCASLIYIFTGGLSWLYIALYFGRTGLFQALIYNFKDMTTLKYDPTLLFYLMPQTQAFALVIMAFILYIWLVSTTENSRGLAVLAGVSLGILVYYHLISAFPLFVLVVLYMLWSLRVREKLEINAIVLMLASFIAAFQLMLLPQNAPSQLMIAHHPNVLLSTIMALGVLVPFGILGAWKSLGNKKARGILIFGLVLFIMLNVITLPLTQNTYRFLVYLTMPASIFSGYWIHDLYNRLSPPRRYLPLLAVLLILPSTMILVGFYAVGTYTHADANEVRALNWICENTPDDAVFLEEPSHFPRIPLVTGRRIAYAGQLYMTQYHGVDDWSNVNSLFYETDASQLNKDLHLRDVSYVFVGHREAKYPISNTLRDANYFKNAYDYDDVQIYRVI
ncbi:MAG: hypothetical protein QMC78_00575 [Methanocellales archaeon]|nr:hypothetical protein [Methanocellales archaeon]